MSTLYFPVRVAALFRRIFHAFSGISISQQYITHLQDHSRESERSSLLESFRVVEGSWVSLKDNWNALRLHSLDISFPWQWNWHVLDFSGAIPPEDEKKNRFRTKFTQSTSVDIIHQLLTNPALYDPLRTPRYPIVLCHGLYGFDSRGPSNFPSMRMRYWANVLSILRDKVKAEVIVTSVPPTGSITSRAEALDRQVLQRGHGRGINFLAHSMGGLDCRHLITHIKPKEYTPLSLTSIATPHRGSPFMDWCAENIGLGKLAREDALAKKVKATRLSEEEKESVSSSNPFLSISSLPSSLLSSFDSPAYANLTTSYLRDIFNPATPDDPAVKYFSVAGRLPSVNIWHPFWITKMVLDSVEEKQRNRLRLAWEERPFQYGSDDVPLWAKEDEWGNDGLVTVQSAKWGTFLGIMEGCDHWQIRGARGLEFGVDLPAFPAIGLGSPTSAGATGNAEHRGWVAKTLGDDNLINSAQIKSSIRLAAVVEWVTEQISVSPVIGSRLKSLIDSEGIQMDGDSPKKDASEMRRHMHSEGTLRKSDELKTKEDLERFYVSLSRKMYDEGL